MKRIIVWLLLGAAALTVCGAFAEEASGEGFRYTVRPDGSAEITGYDGGALADIPATINGRPVRAIGEYAFAESEELEEVRVPEGVLEIGRYAFAWCGALTKAELPDSAQVIEDGNFQGCGEDLTVTVVRGSRADEYCRTHADMDGFSCAYREVVTFGDYEFAILPDGSLRVAAYHGDEGHAAVPESAVGLPVTAIGNHAFSHCETLESVEIPACVTQVGENPFRGCTELSEILLPQDHPTLEMRRGMLISRPDGRLVAGLFGVLEDPLVIPDGVRVIGADAFYENSGYSELVIPEGVAEIGREAFAFHLYEPTVRLPRSLTKIDGHAFYWNQARFVVPQGSEAEAWCRERGYGYSAAEERSAENGARDAANREKARAGAGEAGGGTAPDTEREEPPRALPDVGERVSFGVYEQDAYAGEPKPIEWQVLAADGNRVLLISARALAVRAYHDEKKGVTWETCGLRFWLNHEFLNEAFTAGQQRAILETVLPNAGEAGPGWKTQQGPDTKDKVFLLSYREAERLFGAGDRTVRPTEAVAARDPKTGEADGRWWWLRGAGFSQEGAAVVRGNGTLGQSRTVNNPHGLVRPAIWVDWDALP